MKKEFEIDCGSHLKMMLSIEDNRPTVLMAMDGYGNSMDVTRFIVIEVNETKKEPCKDCNDFSIDTNLGKFKCKKCGKLYSRIS